jgi:hypothetical protein
MDGLPAAQHVEGATDNNVYSSKFNDFGASASFLKNNIPGWSFKID